MDNIKREYSNGEITIIWCPDLCTHSARCFKGLPEVFSLRRRPWVDAFAACTDEIIAQIDRCPSGALSYYWNKPDPE